MSRVSLDALQFIRSKVNLSVLYSNKGGGVIYRQMRSSLVLCPGLNKEEVVR